MNQTPHQSPPPLHQASIEPPYWAEEENYSAIDWFKKALSNFTNFKGRARRKEYWYFYLVFFVISFVAAIIDSILGTDEMILGLVSLVLLLPAIAVSVRRLHDIDKSGWWYLISLIPLIGSIVLFLWSIKDTVPVANQWGQPARKVR